MESTLIITDGLSPALGFAVIGALGLAMLALALAVRSMIRTTDDYVAAGRRIGLGFGVGSVIAVWSWSVAVLTSAAVTYTWGISGLFWFVVPNGLAIMLLAPFALHLRKKLPAGYTITSSRSASTIPRLPRRCWRSSSLPPGCRSCSTHWERLSS